MSIDYGLKLFLLYVESCDGSRDSVRCIVTDSRAGFFLTGADGFVVAVRQQGK